MTEPDQPAATGLFEELLKRRFFQTVAVYVTFAWVRTEICLTLAERFAWPSWPTDLLLILFLMGFPVVLVFAWFYDFDGTSLKRIDGKPLAPMAVLSIVVAVLLGLGSAYALREDAAPAEMADEPITAPSSSVIA